MQQTSKSVDCAQRSAASSPCADVHTDNSIRHDAPATRSEDRLAGRDTRRNVRNTQHFATLNVEHIQSQLSHSRVFLPPVFFVVVLGWEKRLILAAGGGIGGGSGVEIGSCLGRCGDWCCNNSSSNSSSGQTTTLNKYLIISTCRVSWVTHMHDKTICYRNWMTMT